MERPGPLAAAHLSAAWPRRWSASSALDEGTLLETPWDELDRRAAATSGCGAPATSTSRSPGGPASTSQKYGGTFEGIIPELLDKYRTSQEPDADPAARKVHERHPLPRLRRAAAQPAGPRGDASRRRSRKFAEQPRATLPEVCAAADLRRGRVLSASWSSTAHEQLIAAEVLKEIRGRLGLPARTSGWTTSRSTARRRRSPAASRSASAWPGRSAAGWSACCTSSTSRRSACTRATTTGCSTRSRSCATWATRSSSSSTTKTRCGPPTTSSTSAPAPACAAAKSWPSGTADEIAKRAAQRHRPVPVAASRRSKCPTQRRPLQRQAAARSSARGTTTSRTSTSRFRSARSSASPASPAQGKSSLVNDILVEALLPRPQRAAKGSPAITTASKGSSISTS